MGSQYLNYTQKIGDNPLPNLVDNKHTVINHMAMIPPNNKDASVTTMVVENLLIKPKLDVKDLTIRVRFSPQTDKANTQVLSTP